jgi:hypothetical protein
MAVAPTGRRRIFSHAAIGPEANLIPSKRGGRRLFVSYGLRIRSSLFLPEPAERKKKKKKEGVGTR